MAFKGVIGQISEKSEHEVEWTIENFFSYKRVDEIYCSTDFNIFGFTWKFQISPNGRKPENSVGWISLSLLKCYDEQDNEFSYDESAVDGPTVCARSTFGVKSDQGEVLVISSQLYWRKGWINDETRIPRFLERSVLRGMRSEVAPSGSLTLTYTLLTDEYFKPSTSLETLSLNFADLFASKRGCDATLTVKDAEFPVHKWILSARSPVLAAMFEADMKEKRTGLFEIKESDPEPFWEFLMYLYSGVVDGGTRNAFELYWLADMYLTPDLKSYCCAILMQNLTLENVLDAFMLGRHCNHLGLTLKSIKFLNENSQEITSSTQWVEFRSENTDIADKLLNVSLPHVDPSIWD